MRSGHVARHRRLANTQGRQAVGTLSENSESSDALSYDPLRILSRPVKTPVRKKKRKRPSGNLVSEVGLLGTIVTTGIAVIIGLRYLAEAFGVYWIGD